MSRGSAEGLEIMFKGVGGAFFLAAISWLYIEPSLDLLAVGILISLGVSCLVIAEIFKQGNTGL